MKHIIANHNILIGSFETSEATRSYINLQNMHGDECQFEGYYFNCYEALEDGEQGIYNRGVDWNNLKSFADYKKEIDAAHKQYMNKMLANNDNEETIEDLYK
jgi:hypothetical protein